MHQNQCSKLRFQHALISETARNLCETCQCEVPVRIGDMPYLRLSLFVFVTSPDKARRKKVNWD